MVPWAGALAYVGVSGLAFTHWGFDRSLGMLVQAPVYGWFLLVCLQEEPNVGLTLLGWIALAVALAWPRAPKEIIPGFLNGVPRLGNKD